MVEVASDGMAEYRFSTRWTLPASRERVFGVLHDSERWPEWWRGLERVVKLEEGDPEGRGALGRYTWRAAFPPYRLVLDMRIIEVERPSRLSGTASGDLVGTGIWNLRELGGGTVVEFEWHVRAGRWWMKALSPALRPLFKRNHDWVMRQGRRGIECALSARSGR